MSAPLCRPVPLRFSYTFKSRTFAVLNYRIMKRLILLLIGIWMVVAAQAQCSICTKTAQQLGDGPGKGLNGGIIYLMVAPLSVAGFIGYKWWRNERQIQE
jgi:hypothetical protein